MRRGWLGFHAKLLRLVPPVPDRRSRPASVGRERGERRCDRSPGSQRHPYAELALAKYAAVQLYEPEISKKETHRRLKNLERLRVNLTYAPAVRDFSYVVGVACLSLDLPKETALEHLIVVAGSDLHQSRTLASIYVRIGETARQLEKYELALKYYRIFLNRFPVSCAPRSLRIAWQR